MIIFIISRVPTLLFLIKKHSFQKQYRQQKGAIIGNQKIMEKSSKFYNDSFLQFVIWSLMKYYSTVLMRFLEEIRQNYRTYELSS